MDTKQRDLCRTAVFYQLEDMTDEMRMMESHVTDACAAVLRKWRLAVITTLSELDTDAEGIPTDEATLLRLSDELVDVVNEQFTNRDALLDEASGLHRFERINETADDLHKAASALKGEAPQLTPEQRERETLKRQVKACVASLEVMLRALDTIDAGDIGPVSMTRDQWNQVGNAYVEQLRLLRILKG